MRKIILGLLLLVSGYVMAQPPNYVPYASRNRYIALMADSTFHIPRFNGAPSLRTGGSTNDGAIAADTANGRLYLYQGGSWVLMNKDTSNTFLNSLYKKTGTDSVFQIKGGTHTFSFTVGSGLGGSGTVTSVGTGYGLSGGTITTSGTLLLDSATVANYFMRRKDSLTTSNALGYVTKKTLADTAAALRSLTSYITIDKRYDSLAWRRNDSTFLIKSLMVQLNGSNITATKTDSTVSYNILASGPGLPDSMAVIRAHYDRAYDTLVKVNDSTVVWRRFDNTADTVQFHGGTSSVDTTTVPLITFTVGAGFAADTAMVTDSSLFGSLFTGQYQYTIKQIQAVIKGNSGDSIVLKLVYNDTFNVDGTKINGAGFSLNDRLLGNTVTVSTNRTAATNSWLWLKPEAVISGKKPKYISVTLLGYKTYIAP